MPIKPAVRASQAPRIEPPRGRKGQAAAGPAQAEGERVQVAAQENDAAGAAQAEGGRVQAAA